MDTLEFLKERVRMCNSYNGCGECPLAESLCFISNTTSDENLKKMIAAVEQWSKEHPQKTMQSVFLEQWPDARIDVNGVVGLCPTYISAAHRNSDGECNCPEKLCRDCRREFWMREVE